MPHYILLVTVLNLFLNGAQGARSIIQPVSYFINDYTVGNAFTELLCTIVNIGSVQQTVTVTSIEEASGPGAWGTGLFSGQSGTTLGKDPPPCVLAPYSPDGGVNDRCKIFYGRGAGINAAAGDYLPSSLTFTISEDDGAIRVDCIRRKSVTGAASDTNYSSLSVNDGHPF